MKTARGEGRQEIGVGIQNEMSRDIVLTSRQKIVA
jgi:dihydroxyacetone kinase